MALVRSGYMRHWPDPELMAEHRGPGPDESAARLLAVVVLGMAYTALDVFDIVPGILTRDQPRAAPTTTTPTGTATPTAAAVPTIDPAAQPLEPASASAPIPDPAALATALATVVADPALRPGPGVVVRDAFTGQTLLSRDATRARVPASTARLTPSSAQKVP